MSTEILCAMIGLFGTITATLLTYFITNASSKKKLTECKEQYLDDKLKGIVEMYRAEVLQLREDVRALGRQNELLKEEIVDLKERLFRRDLK